MVFILTVFLVLCVIISFIIDRIKYNKRADKTRGEVTNEEYKKYIDIVKNVDKSNFGNDNFFLVLTIIFVIIGILFPPFLFVTAIFLITYVAIAHNNKNKYKTLVIAKFIKEYNPNFIYKKDYGIKEKDYRMANFEDHFDIYNSNDYISGKFNDISFEYSDITVKEEHEDSDGDTSTTTLFEGSFVIAKLSKNIHSVIHVVDNVCFKSKKFNITIDNANFEKYYDVFADDKILAMRILTPDFTTQLIDLKDKYNIYFEFKIFYDTLYIRFYTNDLFEFVNAKEDIMLKELVQNKRVLDAIGIIVTNINDNIKSLEV